MACILQQKRRDFFFKSRTTAQVGHVAHIGERFSGKA